MYVSHLLYPFFCWWTFRLLPCPGYSAALFTIARTCDCYFTSWSRHDTLAHSEPGNLKLTFPAPNRWPCDSVLVNNIKVDIYWKEHLFLAKKTKFPEEKTLNFLPTSLFLPSAIWMWWLKVQQPPCNHEARQEDECPQDQSVAPENTLSFTETESIF